MDMGLEAIVIPVSNADRSKEFYSNLGWRLDADIKKDGDYRVIQFTPPGSACSVIFGVGISKAEPGSYKDLILVVDDVEKAQSELASHGVEVSEFLAVQGKCPEWYRVGKAMIH
jgi:catechol 2,3-dioxygenase-like lactoylglutathione lyase family enzyme